MPATRKIFKDFIARKGLKSTQQRDIILDEFLCSGSHLSTEELYLRIRRKHPNIGYATVYRTLKLFAECGIAEERHFGDGQARYESTSGEEHHDHLICTGCGAILEFEDPGIEELQQKVAAAHGFRIERHRLEIYGLCRKCEGAEGRARSSDASA
ncbi:MAG: transcriptional repressor [Desulfuromonadales bacterium]